MLGKAPLAGTHAERLETVQQDVLFVNSLLSQCGLDAPFPFARAVADPHGATAAPLTTADLHSLEAATRTLITLLTSKQVRAALRRSAAVDADAPGRRRALSARTSRSGCGGWARSSTRARLSLYGRHTVDPLTARRTSSLGRSRRAKRSCGPHSSICARRTPRTRSCGRLRSAQPTRPAACARRRPQRNDTLLYCARVEAATVA